MRSGLYRRRKFVAYAIAIITLVFIIDTGMKAYAQTQKKQEIQETENFNRPEPTRPIQPEVPGIDRYQDDKVFLEYADSLYKLNNRRDTIEKQILKGNVKFRQSGLWMYCDSAYYYPEQNSLDAFSNVRMEQGDTLFVYADKLFYNGDIHLAKLKNGPTEPKVILINKDVTLTTDSLDYDMEVDLGWYTKWGTINDKVNTLTSLYGEYSPRTKRAEFFHDVVLVNEKDGFTMLTDTLYYSTETHIANIESRTEIQSETDTIITNLATYYTDTGDADLLSRSLIIHRDSTGNVTTLEGDSIIYDATTRISRAYMYRDPFKHSSPMVITDTAQKTTLIGGFGIYNDSTKEAVATIYPLLMEYSQSDTLFLRADTIKTFTITEMVAKKGRRKTKSGYPEFNDAPIVRADSAGIWIDTTFFAVKIPYVETPLMMLLKAAPPYQEPEPEPELEEEETLDIDEAYLKEMEEASEEEVMEGLEDIEEMPVEKKEENSDIFSERYILPKDSIYPDTIGPDTIARVGLLRDTVTPEVKRGELKRQMEQEVPQIKDTIPDYLKPDSIPMETHIILAYHRGRFFKQDMQGVADSMVFVERDSMLYMFRKPIIWSEERQVTGNRIDVHFNDSTTDWAYLPEYGLMSEHVDEDFFNQIYGKEITTYFENQGLRRMSVSGNVETIFLPQEEDSTFNRLVNAESSYMEVYLDSNKLDWLKMWPEVSGTVTPIFLVKRNQMFLQKFKWWGFLRPEREWYGDHVRWADNLGEVPEELEQYFLAPSDFGEPKSFTGPRIILPPSSLPVWEDFPGVEFADTLNVAPEFLDSLGISTDKIFERDSIGPDSISPVILHEIYQETLDEVELNEEAESKSAEETGEEAAEIETAALPEEEELTESDNQNSEFNPEGTEVPEDTDAVKEREEDE